MPDSIPEGNPQAFPPDQPTQDASIQDPELLSMWTRRLKKAADNLDPYFQQEKRLWEYWHMWAFRQGPFLSNYVPPDGHAAIESITPRLTQQRPELAVTALNPDSVGKEPHIELMDNYAWQVLNADETFERLTKRGLWLDFAVAKVGWETQTEVGYEEQPIIEPHPVTGEPVQTGVQQVPTVNVTVNRPIEELVDNTDFTYPLGYDSWEKLPWVRQKITKWRSEIDEELYDADALKQLDAEKGGYKPQNYKAERLRVRDFPEPLLTETNDNKNTVLLQEDQNNGGNEKDDYLIELSEIYVRGTKKRPAGQLLTIANDRLILRNKDNPTPKGELPFYGWTPIDDTFHLRGMGLMRAMEKGLLYKKRQRDQRLDNVDLIINSGWFLQENENIEDDELTSYPGNITRLSSLQNAKPKVVPDATGSSVREEQLIESDLGKISASNDYTQGAKPTADRSATEVSALASSSNSRYDGYTRRLNRALNRRGKLLLSLFQANWDQDQMARVIGPDGAAQFATLDLEGEFDLQYDVRPALATKEVVRSQVMDALGVLGKLPPSPFMGPPNLKPLVEEFIKSFDELKLDPAEVITPPPQQQGPMVDPIKRAEAIAALVKAGVIMPNSDIDAILQSLGMPPLEGQPPSPMAGAPTPPPGGPTPQQGGPTPPNPTGTAPTLPSILGHAQTT